MQQNTNDQINNNKLPPLMFVVILLLVALMQTTSDQYLPSLPAISKIFHSNETLAQLTLTLFMLGFGGSHLVYGPMSDRIGRKPPLLFGVGLSIFGSICCLLAPSIHMLLLGRFLQGFGIGCCNSVGRSLVRDLFAGRELAQISSYFGVVGIFIMAASPVLGGYIQEYAGWRANFLFLVGFGFIVWILILFTLPETNKNLHPEATQLKIMAHNYGILLKNKVFLGYSLCASFACAGLFSYFTIAPFLFQNIMGLTPVQFGQLAIFIAGAVGVSGLINSQLVMIWGISFMTLIGIGFMIFGGICLLLMNWFQMTDVLSMMLAIIFFSIGVGFTFVNSFAGAFHPFPHMAGTVGALYASMQDLSAGVATSIIAGCAPCNAHPAYALAVIFLILGLGALAAWHYLTGK